MSLKEKVNAMRVVMTTKACHHGYSLDSVVRTLYAYISELEAKADKPESVKVKVGMIQAEVSAGTDGKLGTADDTVKLSVAKKKAPAKKKATSKKKS